MQLDYRTISFLCSTSEQIMGTWFLNINHPTHTLSISALEEWMQKHLSNIDLSRSALVAAFIELEVVACSCMCYLAFIPQSVHFCYLNTAD
jgi:hypothetical protein